MINHRVDSNNRKDIEFSDGLPIHFGITQSTDSKNYLIGCSVSIEDITKRYSNGNIDIRTVGVKRYITTDIISRKPYPTAKVTFFDDFDDSENNSLIKDLTTEVSTLHCKLIEIFDGEPPSIRVPKTQKASYYFAHNAGLNSEQKQTLLEMKQESKRLEFLVNHYRTVIPRAGAMHELKTQVMLNGHLRSLKPGELI